PDGKRIIVRSWDGLFRVRDLETGTQIGEEWEDKDQGVGTIALSLDDKKIASGSWNGAVKLWSVDTGKVIKTWTGHTNSVFSVCWSPDGGRVVSGSDDGRFIVWDVKSGKTILGPINTGDDVHAVCYSPNAMMIATGTIRGGLKIWNANSATWTVVDLCKIYVDAISISPNDRILVMSYSDKTAQLWDLETNQPIGTPLQQPGYVESVTFSVDGKFLLTYGYDDHIYTWD
ncbi:hypothetical protein CY34DRAFT_36503, partial [Suillus luteus UH-Slu-Lm8-n1]